MIASIGGAIDFGISVANKSALQDAADAAALAGAQAANTYLSNNGTGSTQVSQAIALGNSTAKSVFNANIHAIGSETTPTLTENTTVSSGGSPSVVMSASGRYSPFLLSLAGISSIPMSVTATTTMSPTNAYYQIIFVVDISGSMSIGGDSTTIATMVADQSTACAFACHDPNNLEGVTATSYCNSTPQDYFCQTGGPTYCPWGSSGCTTVASTTFADKRALARTYGYKLKIDYVNSAVQSFMSQLSQYSTTYPGRYTVGIDTFATTFHMLQSPTTNMTTATNTASTIDIEAVTGPVGVTNWGYTYTTAGLTNALSSITNMGNGSSPTKMLTYVVFLTDAVEDIPGSQIYNRGADLNYASECTALKNAGVNMFTIWTPYYNTGDIQYATLVAPLVPSMPTTMQNCASNANQYFPANDGPAITAAVNSTFNTIIANAKLRITN